MSEVLEDAEKRLTAPGCVLLWRTSLMTAIQDQAFLDTNAAEIASLVLQTLYMYHDREPQRAVDYFVQFAATHSNAFVRALAASIVKASAAAGGCPGRAEAFVLLRWTCVVLERLDPEASRKAVSKLLEVVAGLLDALMTGGRAMEARWPAVSRRLRCLLWRRPALIPLLVEHAKASGSSSAVRAVQDTAIAIAKLQKDDNHSAAIRSGVKVNGAASIINGDAAAIAESPSVVPQGSAAAAAAAAARPELLGLYIDRVLNGRERPTPEASAAYKPLLHDLTEEEFSSKVLPALTRSLRRTPEAAISALVALADAITLDLGRFVGELLPLLLQQLRTKEPVRPLALQAVRALARRVSSAEGLKSLFGPVRTALDGTGEGGKVKLAPERAAVVAVGGAIGEAAPPSTDPAIAAVANSVAVFLSTFYREEGSEDVKLAVLAALATWLPRCFPSAVGPAAGAGLLAAHSAAAVPEAAATLLATGLKDSKEGSALRRGLLRCVAVVLRTGSLQQCAALQRLAEPLAKVASEGAAKPAQRFEGVLALLAAACLAHADPGADQLFVKEKTWANTLKADSPVLSAATVNKLSAADCSPVAELAEQLLAHHQKRLQDYSGSNAPAARLLTALLVHYSREVRRSAAAATSRLLRTSPHLCGLLADGLRHWMNNASSLPILQDPALADEGALTPSQQSQRFGRAFLALIPPFPREGPASIPNLDAQQLASLLMAALHPAISTPLADAGSLWRQAARRLPAQALQKALPGAAEQLCESPGAADRRAAQLALGHGAMGSAPTFMYPHVHAALATLLDRSEHDSFTPEDLEVYDCPAGMLVAEKALEGAYVPEVVANKNIKKARGRMRGESRAFAESSSEDEAPAPAPAARPAQPVARPSQAAGGRGGTGGRGGRGGAAPIKDKRMEEFRQARLAEEAQVRARCTAARNKLVVGLEALSAVVRGNPQFASQHLEDFEALCLPLMASHLVGAPAFEAVHALASCLPGELGASGLNVAAALRLVVLARLGQGLNYRDIPSRRPVYEVVQALVQLELKQQKVLPASSYSFVFPVLEAVLSSPLHTPLHDDALALLALHCSPGETLPRRQALTLLYHLLGVMPAYRDRIHPLLKQLCAGALEDDIPAALHGLLAAQPHVRAAALAALPSVPVLVGADDDATHVGVTSAAVPEDVETQALLFLARFDVSDANKETATRLWNQAGCNLPVDYIIPLVRHLANPSADVQQSAASALAAAMQLHPQTVSAALSAVIRSYAGASVQARRGAAAGLRAAAPHLGDEEVPQALDFLVRNGLADGNDMVREAMVLAGMAIVDTQGGRHAATMAPLFETYLEKHQGSSREDESRYDLVREGVVVFLGTLARHLAADDPKRHSVISTLVEVLSTPSEAVQRAVSNCLPPLMPPMTTNKEQLDALIAGLTHTLTRGHSYGDRRGAAFGLAGVVKGLGISAMKNYGVMDSLRLAVEDKRDATIREGALLAFECLSEKLGRLFEPYIIYILPLLLNCFGDVSPMVRRATEDASRMIMGQLTASGVKLVLPALLKGLEDKAWRTKQGSVQLLGAMAYCAPRQLGTCLPTIVPRLGEVLSDPHPKVQTTAQQALNEIGSVIRNEEVKRLVPHLLAAIADPNGMTKPCLDILLDTTFINTIDAPSLALIVPVVHRGLRDRSGDTKKRAARIVGNMCTLVNDPKDMTPYVPMLMPELQKALVDPLPEVRATSARAMGSLLQGMGTDSFGDLVPWLMATLRSDGSSVERSGAAQGLAEVLSVLGADHLEALLPDIVAGCDSRSVFVREGHLTLLQYLPLTLADVFEAHLSQVLPCILGGLADEAEGVRDAALAAGRVVVDKYAQTPTALDLILPAVEGSIFADNWRIRQSSLLLMGKLLFKVAGTSGNIQVDGGSDDEGAAEENYDVAITAALGAERRNGVLARLYIARSDVQYPVRTEALHVWKTVVVNTPKTLGQVLPCLMSQVIESLAHEGEDRRQMAARCLGELVRKMGDRVLAKILPILRQGASDPSAATRQGVCFGLKEVLENLARQQIAEHLHEVLPAVQAALCDSDADVREAAGAAFGILFRGGPNSAVDSVVPSMMAGLEQDATYSESLEGLRVILGVRPQVFNFLLPRLLKAPLQVNNVRALGSLAPVAASVLGAHVSAALASLLVAASLPASHGQVVQSAKEAALAVALAVPEDSLYMVFAELLKGLEDPARRRGCCELITTFSAACKLDFQESVPSLVSSLVVLLVDDDKEVVQQAWKALDATTASVPKESQPALVRPLRDAVATAREKERRKRRGGPLLVAGFCLPKALSPVLPIYLQGILQGSSAELKETASEGLGELVDVTSEDALKPFVLQITGPLIRIIGDRFPSPIKAAMLTTLGLLIHKAGPALKPFVAPLQTSFLKCLNDQAQNVRQRAAENLGDLTVMSARVDQLACELAASARTAEPQVRDAYLQALRGVLLVSGQRLSPATLATLGDTLRDSVRLAAGDDEAYRSVLASTLGAYAKHIPADSLRQLLTVGGPLSPSGLPGGPAERHLHAMTLATVALHAGSRLEEAGVLKAFGEAVVKASRDDKVPVKVAAGHAAARLAATLPQTLPGAVTIMVTLLGPDQASEVQRQALLAIRRLASSVEQAALEPHYSSLLPSICALLGEAAGPTRAAGERTVQRLLRLDANLDTAQDFLASGGAGSLVRQTLTDGMLRRLNKLPEEEPEVLGGDEY